MRSGANLMWCWTSSCRPVFCCVFVSCDVFLDEWMSCFCFLWLHDNLWTRNMSAQKLSHKVHIIQLSTAPSTAAIKIEWHGEWRGVSWGSLQNHYQERFQFVPLTWNSAIRLHFTEIWNSNFSERLRFSVQESHFSKNDDLSIVIFLTFLHPGLPPTVLGIAPMTWMMSKKFKATAVVLDEKNTVAMEKHIIHEIMHHHAPHRLTFSLCSLNTYGEEAVTRFTCFTYFVAGLDSWPPKDLGLDGLDRCSARSPADRWRWRMWTHRRPCGRTVLWWTKQQSVWKFQHFMASAVNLNVSNNVLHSIATPSKRRWMWPRWRLMLKSRLRARHVTWSIDKWVVPSCSSVCQMSVKSFVQNKMETLALGV